MLEIKAPSEEITRDVLDQAISYARHPEVSGTYAAVLNGKKFVVVHSSQRSVDVPIVDINASSWKEIADHVTGLLSPEAIRRDCSPPIVDLKKPLSDGLRSRCHINGGVIRYVDCVWETNIDSFNEIIGVELSDRIKQLLDAPRKVLCGYRANITNGLIWRDEASRVRAKFEWSVPRDEILKFAQDKRIMESEFVSFDDTISSDDQNPTRFDVVGDVSISEGESIFDIHRWETQIVGIATSVTYRGQALGYIRDAVFVGTFETEFESSFPSLPIDVRICMYALGEFEISLDPR